MTREVMDELPGRGYGGSMSTASVSTASPAPHAGALLRQWRERRNLSQLALASGSAVSTRHLSFIETGRSRPSREMILHLAERLDVPLRERNRLLLAGGYAPAYGERPLDDDAMAPVREALERLLAAHLPYPALVVDRRWDVVLMNDALGPMLAGAAEHLLLPPTNALRVTLHPEGMAPAIVNFAEWSAHVLARLDREIWSSGDTGLQELRAELAAYPGVCEPGLGQRDAATDIVLPLRLRVGDQVLSLLTTQTVFGTPTDVTLSELSIEALYPADRETAALLAALDGNTPAGTG